MPANKPIRVAQIMGKMLGGGVEAVVMNYYRHIDRSQVQFDFLVDADSTLVPREEIESLGGRVFEISPYQHVFEYQKELQRLFKQEGWKIVHSHINALSVFSLRAAKKAGVPVRIAHSHSTWGRGEFKKNAMKAALRLFANVYPTHRMACSEHAGKWLFGNAPFQVIPSAIDCARFAYSDEKRERARSQWNIPDGAFVIGHVGRLSPQKNQVFLVRVLKDVRDSGIDVRLVLIGEGPDREMLQEEAGRLGLADYVIMPGFADTADVYSGFDVFAFPSQYEGFGMAAVEAQVAGLPCLLSSSVPRIAKVTAECAFLPLKDFGVWSSRIVEFVGKRRKREALSVGPGSCDVRSCSTLLTESYVRFAIDAAKSCECGGNG